MRERLGEKRVSRRWMLGAMGATAGAAGLAALRCSDGDGDSPAPTPTEIENGTPGASPTPRQQDGKRGETLRFTGFVARDQTFDPHKTQAGPFYGHQALIYSRLLAYQDQAKGAIVPDLAAAMPEMPDGQTMVFRLNPNARWHELAPLNGRSVTAADVKYSIERQLAGDQSFVRKAQWSVIDGIDIPNERTVTFKLKSPMAALHHLFADVHSFIVAPEVSGDKNDIGSTAQVGSGPFQWVEWVDGRHASVRRNPNWHGGDRRPNLDGVSLVQPASTATVEGALRTREVDAATVGRVLADKLKKAIPQLTETTMGHSQFFGMRFSLGNDPFNDLRFRSAVTIALDRRAMIDKFFGGSGGVNPWVSWPMTDWALPETELTTSPGYRPGAGGRGEDLREARALLEAFKSEKKLKDDLPLFVLQETEAALEFGATIKAQLAESLGLEQVRVVPLPLAELARLLLTGEAPWAAAPDNGWIDLDDWVYPYFHANGTKNSFPLRDAEMTAMIDAQRVELDKNARREIGYNIQRRLLALNVGVNLVSERVVSLAWPYVKGFPLDTADGYQHRFADCWIDQADPTFRGR
ncbi:MAG: ABC transporter substrate-binding protein [Dehalococcoidia bacterium]|uniref:ABC transporter substrate-binding protein n=1 Tax=Candidatus Amarobacter glycogenicus TaxID=3140699 RepID=UPI001D738CE6|nr:ABC transporter substrate-binding protein [Dehalococcoidia bacterium]MBK9611253.1 ABC transporter substrate-binding protein [Dehalococcoidia bacterium]